MKIDCFGLASMGIELRRDIMRAVSRVVDSGVYVLGPEVEAFEREFAEFVGTRYCVLVANGLDALHLSLAAAGIGPGDEVIVPSQTFQASLIAPLRLGATAVMVDVHPVTGLINVDNVADAIGPRTAALIPVHLHGAMADMERLRAIAQKHGLALIEDAAQAHGARTSGLMAGSMGLAGAFSFYPTKNLGALGDAGCVTTDDPMLAAKIRSLRNYSRDEYTGDLPMLPQNSRTDALQAAILREFLPRLSTWNTLRQRVAESYVKGLKDCVDPAQLACAWGPGLSESVFHHFALLVAHRDRVIDEFAVSGMRLISHYSTLPHDEVARRWPGARESQIRIHSDGQARINARHTLSLPMHPFLNENDIEVVLAKLTETLDQSERLDLWQSHLNSTPAVQLS